MMKRKSILLLYILESKGLWPRLDWVGGAGQDGDGGTSCGVTWSKVKKCTEGTMERQGIAGQQRRRRAATRR